MENETDELQVCLRRCRYLLDHTTDAGAARVLRELIAEAQARLNGLEQEGAALADRA